MSSRSRPGSLGKGSKATAWMWQSCHPIDPKSASV